MKRTSKKTLTDSERKQFYSDLRMYKEIKKEEFLQEVKDGVRESVALSLLDSSLISATQNIYQTKIISCGDYIQVYYFNKTKVQRKKELSLKEQEKKRKKIIDTDYLFKRENYPQKNDLKTIEFKNIMRSKFQLQRIVKANENEFKTFITLTFQENITNIELANKKFHSWRTKIKSIYPNFKYVCVPEFQKRGAVHYHLLTNLEINKTYTYLRRNKEVKTILIYPQKEFSLEQLNNMTLEKRKKCYDILYWKHGYTSIFPIKSTEVVGYMTKYMTKDIDNRLFSHHRYLNSKNLILPKELYLNNKNNGTDFLNLFYIENYFKKVYENSYLDYEGDEINFVEFKKESVIK